MIHREVLQSGVRSAINTIRAFSVDSNLRVERLGVALVEGLISRYLRRQQHHPIATDWALDQMFEIWLEKSTALCQSGTSVPIVDLADKYGWTPLETYIVFCVYAHHVNREIRDMLTSVHGDLNKTDWTPSLIAAMFEPTNWREDANRYYNRNEVLRFLQNHEVFIWQNVPDNAAEPRVVLSRAVMHALDADFDASVWHSPYYSVYTNHHVHFAAEDYHEKLVEVCRSCLQSREKAGLCFLLSGAAGNGKRTFVRYAGCSLELPVCEADTAALVQLSPHHWQRVFHEMASQNAILLVPHVECFLGSESSRVGFCRCLEHCRGFVFLTTENLHSCEGLLLSQVHQIVDFVKPDAQRRMRMIQQMMPGLPNRIAEQVASDYMLSAAQIVHACELCHAIQESGKAAEPAMVEACERVMMRSFDGLAVQTYSDAARLSRFVLPPDQMAAFETILRAAKGHSKVMHEWGFSHHLATGKGLCILFDGAPGTGKTFAAEVIAGELHRPLQRVDMSNLVSKWVGETGENIAKLFAAARTNHAILLLDEADALLSKRTAQTSKSTDRYANMEINIILQEIERYDGITILTTNLGQTLDEALERRIQYRITFKEPGVSERQKLWRSLIAPEAQVEPDINYFKLARDYELCGGHIKNAILHAAHLAAPENRAISEQDLTMAAQIEFLKLGHLVQKNHLKC